MLSIFFTKNFFFFKVILKIAKKKNIYNKAKLNFQNKAGCFPHIVTEFWYSWIHELSQNEISVTIINKSKKSLRPYIGRSNGFVRTSLRFESDQVPRLLRSVQ